MLEEPRSQDVGRHLREDAPLLLVLFAVGVVVLLAGALATAYTRVARVTCEEIRRRKERRDAEMAIFYSNVSPNATIAGALAYVRIIHIIRLATSTPGPPHRRGADGRCVHKQFKTITDYAPYGQI